MGKKSLPKPRKKATRPARKSTKKTRKVDSLADIYREGKAKKAEKEEVKRALKSRKQIQAMSVVDLFNGISNAIKSGGDEKDIFIGTVAKLVADRVKESQVFPSFRWNYPDIDDSTKFRDAFLLSLDGNKCTLKITDQQAIKQILVTLSHDDLVLLYQKMFT